MIDMRDCEGQALALRCRRDLLVSMHHCRVARDRPARYGYLALEIARDRPSRYGVGETSWSRCTARDRPARYD